MTSAPMKVQDRHAFKAIRADAWGTVVFAAGMLTLEIVCEFEWDINNVWMINYTNSPYLKGM